MQTDILVTYAQAAAIIAPLAVLTALALHHFWPK
jgi:hypothetical protein